MQNKLQELTDKLYSEGLSKGKQEAETMVAQAKTQAKEIVQKAEQEAQQILESAKKKSEDIVKKAESDIKMASTQTISALKQQLEQIIILKVMSSPIKENLNEKEFISNMISVICKAFNASAASPIALNLILSESQKGEFGNFIKEKIGKELSKGIDIQYSKQFSCGFKIGPKDEAYLISFTEGDFENLFMEFVRPSTKKILFG